ncbi:T6SS effector BTH_I2691 family protein [Burkholderia glumae]|uniref:T6SS effector BTH_I2691 family protein n=1 Tax=Burkholderia glumae TaxID=337 RepID=UPI002150332E|nr:T6SS effector BTH_I2691 family protein [Burkholderia glumae]
MEVTAEWAEKIAKSLEKAKTFWEFWEKMKEVKEHENPIFKAAAGLKALHIDKLMTAIAPSLFKWTRFGLVGNCAGTYLLRGAMLMRVGISHTDAIELVKTATRTELPMLNKLKVDFLALHLRGVPAANAYAQTLDNLASSESGQLRRAKWNAVKVTSEGADAVGAVRLTSTLAFIEVVSFAASLSKTDKSVEGYASLVASGFSAASACSQVSTKAATALAEDVTQTWTNLKAIAGYLSGAAALNGGVVDFGKIFDQRKQSFSGAMLYFAKSALGLAAAARNILTALTSLVPFIGRMTGQFWIIWIVKVDAGIVGVTAYNKALAKPATIGVAAAERNLAVERVVNVAFDTATKGVAGDVIVSIAERAFLIGVGRVTLFLAGWEVAVAITLIQVLIWYFSDNDLQAWMKNCWFGSSLNSPPWEAGEQHEKLEKALGSLSLQAGEGSE